MSEEIINQTLEGTQWSDPPRNTIGIHAIYTGPVLPRRPDLMPFPPFIDSSNATLDAWGSKAIAQCKPTNSVADASVFLGELLHDGIPKLLGAALWKQGTENALKASSQEYLNAQFGWKPLVNDMRKFAYAVRHADQVLSQFERDAGKVVRRKYSFPTELSATTELVATGASPFIAGSASALSLPVLPTGDRNVFRIRNTERRRWFSGAFTYYLPSGGNARSVMGKHAQEAKKLLGLSLTPDTVWNLSPWSWAVDWVSNTGDVLSNLTDWAVDGLTLRYGYIMEHTMVTDTYVYSGPTGFQSTFARPSSVSLVAETKVRRKATPFGFGLTWGGLSPRQLAIAAALGITHS
ncbi:TPA_asm: maturation protein [ssRNA phage Gerhypos.4_3]|uniref:Maturation protein n=2 Tax=Leviviricetes TaxID=2842243 RepID=A0A8S5KXT0_9VIRU|nr:maturation protein [ssRNA phage Gerhypos.4_3]DAD50193.1 TPA_asm: maturation protein [ssRNA phage Gerhypos.4_3]